MVVGQVNVKGKFHSHLHRCLMCGRLFGSKRSDALHCSDACKQKAYRQRRRQERQRHRQKCIQLGLPIPMTGWEHARIEYNL